VRPWIQLVWRGPVVHLPPSVIRPVLIPCTSEHPRGWKGDVIRQGWLAHRDRHPGVVYVDGDSAIEPPAVMAMEAAIDRDPDCVWTAAVRTWGRPIEPGEFRARSAEEAADLRLLTETAPDVEWLDDRSYRIGARRMGQFAHRVRCADGRYRWGRQDDDAIHFWGFGCTFVPNALCARVEELGLWGLLEHPRDDLQLVRISHLEPEIRARLVPHCTVAHMHWNETSLAELAIEAQEAAEGAATGADRQ
jgi:hypothetical protein